MQRCVCASARRRAAHMPAFMPRHICREKAAWREHAGRVVWQSRCLCLHYVRERRHAASARQKIWQPRASLLSPVCGGSVPQHNESFRRPFSSARGVNARHASPAPAMAPYHARHVRERWRAPACAVLPSAAPETRASGAWHARRVEVDARHDRNRACAPCPHGEHAMSLCRRLTLSPVVARFSSVACHARSGHARSKT